MNKSELIRKELRLIIRELGLLNYNCLNSGLTLAQAHILNYLKRNGVTPVSELLLQLGIDKASLSRILSNLASKNYIEVSKSNIDRRAKCVKINPQGLDAIINGQHQANMYMNEILKHNDEENVYNFVKSLREFRIYTLRRNLLENDLRISFEILNDNYYEDGIKLAIEVFNGEQNIPKDLIPVKEKLKPTWWCARVGEDVIGVAARWNESGKCHWGRFAVDKRLRGLEIGKKLALISLKESFKSGDEKIYIDARDITLKMFKKYGCEVVGESIDFYRQPVTPIIITKENFDANNK